MVEHPHVLEQPVLVQTYISFVTVVTIDKEVAMPHAFEWGIGVKYPLVRKVSFYIYNSLTSREILHTKFTEIN